MMPNNVPDAVEAIRNSQELRKALALAMKIDPDAQDKLEKSRALYDTISELFVTEDADDGVIFVVMMKLLKTIVDAQDTRDEKVRMLVGIHLGVEALERGLNNGSII